MRALAAAVLITALTAVMSGPGLAAAPAPSTVSARASAALRIAGGALAPVERRRDPNAHDVPSPLEVVARAQERDSQAAVDSDLGDGFAGDLDGDGRADILTHDRTDGGAGPLVLNGRRGIDGARLWSRTLPGGYVRTARVGGSAKGGAYVYEYPDDDHGWRFTAVDAVGDIAWEREFETTPVDTPVTTGAGRVLYDFWFVDAATGPATDLLLSFWTYQVTPVGFLLTVEAQVIDGATGEMKMVTTETALDREPEVTPISDVDGDGVDDIVVAVYDYQDSGSVSVRSGATGLPLWHNPLVPLAFGATTFSAGGDLDGDGREELVASYEWWHDQWTYSLSGLVLDGASGLELFEVSGLPYRLGDTDGDGDDELGALEAAYDDEEFSVWILVYDGRGTELRRAGATYDSVDVWDGAAWAETIGDVDADGVTDAQFALWLQDRDGTVIDDSGVVAGATGRVLWTGAGAMPMHTTIDGAGDDYLRLSREHTGTRRTRITPVDGGTGQPLWHQTTEGGHHFYDSADVDGDGGGELLLMDASGEGELTLLRSRDGHVMWSDRAGR